MDLLTAAAEAANVGMIVVPVGEDDSYTAPGQGQAVVVRQNPLPGTLMVLEPDTNGNRQTTIEVTLSKRA
jgi:hypothetical protein